MKKLKAVTISMWIIVLGSLICVLALTMSTKNNDTSNVTPNNGNDVTDIFGESENFKIIDKTETCAEALEEVYRDDEYIYYLPCIKSGNITIKFKDGYEYPLKVALENELLTIEELEKVGLGLIKEKIEE